MLDDKGLDIIFRQARTHDAISGPVSDARLREVYELMKWGPTTTNTQPMRIVFVRSKEAKEKLRPALSPGNLDKLAANERTAFRNGSLSRRPAGSFDGSGAVLVELVEQDKLILHGAGEAQLHRPLAHHFEIELGMVLAGRSARPRSCRAHVVRHRHRGHIGAHRDLGAGQRLTAARQLDGAVVDEIGIRQLAIKFAPDTLRERRKRGEN